MQKIFNLCIISFNELAKANHTKGYKNQQKKGQTGLFIQIKVKNIRIRV